ncbi:nucleotidyltransferase family protein [Lysinibacillus sphaericus]|uniref:Mannose-1-phosphate guanyltransferase 2 n=3 Tax=Lysinibacillus TaxID=400634 RepID=B1HN58_LYSSC|nr:MULTISPECIES: nucleotidyltransferase family protein [Lysinibacillus]MBE5084774.1 nucleotidyltransferase family protein [Bacillus thuringiensis]ACA38775.1 Mannose-1-phosphate guanyltransferase 2 [Lysinibacillus sphaericus C3-41]AMO34969.1 alcohol dehydrogenase [Lysinibacillus sphaericus]AMR89916.1 alcohol dehydrogenase [Lysinibacillus sphaericus]ANA47986.1 alcohol dehydrogenase [Lysinibacillus sphaericus]
MKKWQKTLVDQNHTLLETMKIIDNSSLQFAVVVDEEQHLLGTVTDGDIRRGILRGEGLDVKITSIMNPNPITAKSGQRYHKYKQLMKSKMLKQLPIVDENNRIINILFADNIETTLNKNTVVLMLGGLGTRLRPLTNDTPKPMLRVGNKPILETIIEGFKQYGYTNFIFSVNYKKEVIQDYFQNGEAFDVTIEYIEEDKKMGTAGALSLLKKRPTKPFFVMNGDLLTQINFDQLMQFHMEHESVATMCVREFEYQIPFGVIETNGTDLVTIKEKPIHRSFVNAGIYLLNPDVLDYIPQDEFYDMPSLFEKLIEKNSKTSVFPIREYWLDIGQIDDFNKANNEVKELLNEA